jgi:hypothetical protein
MNRVGIALIVLSGVVACEKKEEENTSGIEITPGDGKLPLSELAEPTGLADLTATDIQSFMQIARSDFLATEAEIPEEESEPIGEGEEEVDCFGDGFSKVKVSAAGEKVSVDVNLDLTGCLKKLWSQEQDGVSADISKAKLAIYIEQTCVGLDLSSYDGKSLEEMETPPECGTTYMLMNMKSEMLGSMSANGQTTEINSVTVNSVASGANEPCFTKKTGETLEEDGCVEIYKSVGGEGSVDNEYSRYWHKNLTWTDSEKNSWYTSGSIDVDLNGWSGSVSFQGATTNPSYTMNNGSETVNGTLSLPSNSFLKGTLLRALHRNTSRLKSL